MQYTVKSGDTLSSIAKKFLGDARKYPLIVAANQLSNPNVLPVGKVLTIPDPATDSGVAIPPPPVSPVVHPGIAAQSEQRLAKVLPALATRARAMVELLAHSGVEILITQGLRTWEEQDALYAKGRTEAPIGKQFIVTNAKGGQSYHNFGLAFDIVVLDAIGKYDWDSSHPGWATAANAGKSVGLEWGGDWKTFKDIPHYQYTGGLTLAQCQEAYRNGGLPAVWAEIT
jgi:LysM repeat protein